mmetsp:Transcript_97949/g.204320  ORF Transcript_97949/g.204320 Transcript_97949/m.204320 type:complete len:203 (+) Transcript_97949:450-1058(+)
MGRDSPLPPRLGSRPPDRKHLGGECCGHCRAKDGPATLCDALRLRRTQAPSISLARNSSMHLSDLVLSREGPSSRAVAAQRKPHPRGRWQVTCGACCSIRNPCQPGKSTQFGDGGGMQTGHQEGGRWRGDRMGRPKTKVGEQQEARRLARCILRWVVEGSCRCRAPASAGWQTGLSSSLCRRWGAQLGSRRAGSAVRSSAVL